MHRAGRGTQFMPRADEATQTNLFSTFFAASGGIFSLALDGGCISWCISTATNIFTLQARPRIRQGGCVRKCFAAIHINITALCTLHTAHKHFRALYSVQCKQCKVCKVCNVRCEEESVQATVLVLGSVLCCCCAFLLQCYIQNCTMLSKRTKKLNLIRTNTNQLMSDEIETW